MWLGTFLIIWGYGKWINRSIFLHLGSLLIAPAWTLSASSKAWNTCVLILQLTNLSHRYSSNHPLAIPLCLEHTSTTNCHLEDEPQKQSARTSEMGLRMFGIEGYVLGDHIHWPWWTGLQMGMSPRPCELFTMQAM